jgi:hypothetical protein
MKNYQLKSTPVAKMDTPMSKGTKTLLVSGIVAGPLFIVVVLIQVFTRQGFDLVRLPLSLLSLGDLGWIQKTNFVVDGLLAVACAVGLRRRLYPDLGGTWGPFLVGVYGVGLIAAGFFPPDPAFGFPPGTAQGVPAAQSWHSQLHGYAFDIAFLSLIVACFVFARRFVALRRWGWAAYCAVTGLATPALIVLGFTNAPIMGMLFFGAGAITMGWLALVAAGLLAFRHSS